MTLAMVVPAWAALAAVLVHFLVVAVAVAAVAAVVVAAGAEAVAGVARRVCGWGSVCPLALAGWPAIDPAVTRPVVQAIDPS